jgi:hypothetical protein
MRCLMLAGMGYVLGLVVGLLALVQLPLEFFSRLLQRFVDQVAVDYWLAVVERKTQAQIKARRLR